MASLKRDNKGWKVLSFALLAIPWFLKDHLATSLDQRSQEAQEVLIEESAQRLREEQGLEQRQQVNRLARIELRQIHATGALSEEEVARAVEDNLSRSFNAEGKALHHSAQQFDELLSKIAMDAALNRSLEAKAQQVEAVAQDLEKFKPETSRKDYSALLDRKDHAEEALGDAYEHLLSEAEKDRDSSARLAHSFHNSALFGLRRKASA